MGQPSSNDIVDIILGRRDVYGLDTDSRIREAANRLTTRAFFEVLARVDADAPDFGSILSDLFSDYGSELIGVIGFATPGRGTTDPSDAEVEADERREYCLKLVFRDEQAAYYQYPLFPDLNAHYILGAMRKRTGAVQHLRVTLSSPEVLQAFIESCHVNPHLLRVEKSTVDEFDRAASNAV